MNLIELKCNNCGASLKLDIDNMMAYCPYCGAKLLVDMAQLGSLLKEREITKREIAKASEKTKQISIEQQTKIAKDKETTKVFIIAFIFIIALVTVLLISETKA